MNLIRLISRLLGYLFMISGWIIALSMGIWAFFGAFDVVTILFGKFVAILSLFIFPVPLGLAPWYLGFAYGYWTLLFITYGALPVFWIFMAIGSIFFKLGEKE